MGLRAWASNSNTSTPCCGANCHPPPPGSGSLGQRIAQLLAFLFGFFHL
jgi:hypothetical protein